MTQEYDFKKGIAPWSTNTSSESASTLQPSPRAIRNILNFARCTQTIRVRKKHIRLYLN